MLSPISPDALSALIDSPRAGDLLAGLSLGAALAGVALLACAMRVTRRNDELSAQVSRGCASLLRTREAVIIGLAKLAEFRDDDTGAHLDRVRDYVQVLARELARTHPGLTPEHVATLGLASSLHDIGKVGIPDAVLFKPDALTPRERRLIEQHTLIGGDCLMAIKRRLGEDDFLETACEVTFAHHERWDGNGYPFGLKGEVIPLSARIVAVADAYDALTSERSYKSSMTHERARAVILAESGRAFDPRVVDAFLACEHELRDISTAASRAEEPFSRRKIRALEARDEEASARASFEV